MLSHLSAGTGGCNNVGTILGHEINTFCIFLFFYLSTRIFVECSSAEWNTGVFEIRAQILTTSYWLHVELGKNILKGLCQKIK
jgi:hypothetical protein